MIRKIINLLCLFFSIVIILSASSCIILPKQTASLYEDVYQTKLSIESLDKKVNTYNATLNQSFKNLIEENNTSSRTTNRNLADLNDRMLKMENQIIKLQAAIDELTYYISKTSSQVPASEGDEMNISTPNIQSSVQSEVLQGRKLFNQGEYEKAISIFNEVLTRNPESEIAAEAYYYIGHSYYYLNDFKEAIKNFNQIIVNYPESELAPYSLLRIGDSYLKLDDKEEAKKYLQEVMDKYPDFKEIRLVEAKLKEIE